MKTNFLGYLPDADPTTQGVIVDCDAMLPSVRGMEGAPSAITAGAAALSAACYGAALGIKLDNTYRVFAGTLTKLYEMSSTTWTDRTRAVGGDYTTSTAGRWRFAQFGDTSLACNGADTLQSSSTAAFANISGAPIANCIDTVSGFVMLGGVNLGAGAGMEYDRWICSAYNDATSGSAWTPAVSTQCTTGRLVDTPGKITGIRKLGYDCVAYKNRSMYFGTYEGGAEAWKFRLIPGDIGAPCQEAVVNIGPEHIFIGYEDIYRFDGSRPVPIGEGIRETFFTDLNKQYRHNVIGVHDFVKALVYFYYPSSASASGAIDSCIVYNYRTGKWGRDDRAIEAAVEYLTGQITYANIGDYFASYAAINVAYDSPFWVNTSPVNAYFDTAHTLQTLTGASAASSLTTGDMGDDALYVLLSRARPRYTTQPTTATVTNYYKNESGGSYTTGATTTVSSGKADMLQSASWHRLKYDFTGDVEISGHDVTLTEDGQK